MLITSISILIANSEEDIVLCLFSCKMMLLLLSLYVVDLSVLTLFFFVVLLFCCFVVVVVDCCVQLFTHDLMTYVLD